ncbi:hypothetical protein GOODEAATRI_005673 [Goodea atripinnis]|uniref:Tetratricopeptide repeat protein 7 N-terminal domain-containing protein n=1 Tax=Goodea atripinnis TaxID=208336 RepID=A0ABV0MZ74_9TELE
MVRMKHLRNPLTLPERESVVVFLVESSSPQSRNMTARKSGSRLEIEIERCRSEGQWDKIPELVRQLSAKLISNGRKLVPQL